MEYHRRYESSFMVVLFFFPLLCEFLGVFSLKLADLFAFKVIFVAVLLP